MPAQLVESNKFSVISVDSSEHICCMPRMKLEDEACLHDSEME